MNPAQITFESDDLGNMMASLSADEVDGLAFGAIELDGTGLVLRYNVTESEITGRQPDRVIGRNFFNDIAPCCNNPAFRGIFDTGVASGKLNAIFDFEFDYKMNPTRVIVQMKSAMVGGTFWIFVKRR